MPLCPQITNTPITVVLNSDFTVTSVIPVLPATTIQVNAAISDAAAASAAAAAAAAVAATAVQTSANTIVNASNQLTAINGNGITVYAGSSPTSGARVVLNSSGLAGFNTGGSATFAISASSGTVEVTGGILSGGSITGTSINVPSVASPAFSVDALGAVVASNANITGTINSNAGNIAGFTLSSGVISAPSSSLNIYSNGTIQGGNSQTIFYGFANIGGGTAGSERLIVTGNSSFDGTIVTTGAATINGELRAVFGQANPVTNAANVWISSTGQIRRTTASSARYKENITDLRDVAELDPKKLLKIPVRAFSYKNDSIVAGDDRAGILIPGLIAEEVDAIYPLAADYSNGQVENINDRAILVNLLALVQDLYKEIATLKGE